MRLRLTLAAKRIAHAAVFFAAIATTPAAAQTRTRVISWQPHTYGRITVAAEGVRLSTIAEAVEIVGFTAEGSPVTLGEPFAAGDEWLRSLRVRLRNTSGQTISTAQMTFVLPETRAGGQTMIGLTLGYGGVWSSDRRPVQPGEEFELSLGREGYERLRARTDERKGAATTDRLFITVISVRFADGAIWGSGCVKATDPKNSCHVPAT